MNLEQGFDMDAFRARLEEAVATLDAKDVLNKTRLRAWNHFLELGLPNKKTEVYQYIKLRHLYSNQYQPPADASTLNVGFIESLILPESLGATIVLVNGYYRSDLSNTTALPSKIVISSLSDASRLYGTLLNNHWNRSLKEEKDPFAAINTALHPKGVFIYIPPKTEVAIPIQVLHLIDSSEKMLMVTPRINLFMGSHSDAHIVIQQKNLSTHPYFVNQVFESTLDENSHLKLVQINGEEHESSWHFDAVRSTLKKNATLNSICMTEGALSIRNDYHILLQGENAEASLNGVWMLKDKREAHANIYMDHQAPNCRSNQHFKSVLSDYSRSSFEGKIMVRQEAQKTAAFQLNNNLILGDHSHADSKPNLEIFADDVKATHGSTTGQLDQEQLFYMKTRGFSDSAAKNLLIYGFCEEIIERITIPSLRKSVSERAREYIKGR